MRRAIRPLALLLWLALAAAVLAPADAVHTAHTALAQATCPYDESRWHPPACGHEHGDAPPQWIADAGYTVGFDEHGGFHGNTSAIENTTKHASMKGMVAQFGNQQGYIRYHLASNVMERSARYHSYEVFLRDAQGGVSHWQGWYNSGDPATDRLSKSQPDPGRRPLVLVADYPALLQGKDCEQWYGFTASWSWDIGLTICRSTTMQYADEARARIDGSPLTGSGIYDPANWVVLCGYGYPSPSCLGNDRELEASWYGPDSKAAPNRGAPPHGVVFYATQFGEIVAGPTDPRCSGTTTKFGTTYPNVCLSQYIATTARAVENPNNRTRRTFDTTGVAVPN